MEHTPIDYGNASVSDFPSQQQVPPNVPLSFDLLDQLVKSGLPPAAAPAKPAIWSQNKSVCCIDIATQPYHSSSEDEKAGCTTKRSDMPPAKIKGSNKGIW